MDDPQCNYCQNNYESINNKKKEVLTGALLLNKSKEQRLSKHQRIKKQNYPEGKCETILEEFGGSNNLHHASFMTQNRFSDFGCV